MKIKLEMKKFKNFLNYFQLMKKALNNLVLNTKKINKKNKILKIRYIKFSFNLDYLSDEINEVRILKLVKCLTKIIRYKKNEQ